MQAQHSRSIGLPTAAAIALLLSCGTARARNEERLRDAREHFDRGMTYYNLADFDPAIDEFKQAYELTKSPRLLFNIAQAHRLKKRYEQALYFYSAYLRLQPDALNRADVEGRIAEMSQLAKERPSPPEPPPEPIAPAAKPGAPSLQPSPPERSLEPAAPVTPTNAPHLRPGRRTLIAGLALAGGGLALLTGAIGASAAAATAGAELRELSASGGTWTDHAANVYADGERNQAAGIALWALGGAAAAVGVALAITGGLKARAARSITLSPAAGGAALSVGGTLP
jgi:tetratricopeptide (TPR) repeat protein